MPQPASNSNLFSCMRIMNNDFFKITSPYSRLRHKSRNSESTIRDPQPGSLTGIRSWYLFCEIDGTDGKPSVFDPEIEKSLLKMDKIALRTFASISRKRTWEKFHNYLVCDFYCSLGMQECRNETEIHNQRPI